MLINEFDYQLPTELIAQEPLPDREASRMLTVSRTSGEIADRKFVEFPGLLRHDDLLVVNNTRVFPARLMGTTDTGAKVELFLVRVVEGNKWEALARPGRRLRPGKKVFFGDQLSAEVLDREAEGVVIV